MADVGYTVEGLSRLTRDLKAAGADVDDLKDAFAKIAKQGTDLAAGYAPKRTGRLAASIRGNRAAGKAVVTAGRASVKYAGPINYGFPKRNIAPSGFMQRASDEVGPKALDILQDEVNQAIRARGLDR
jgi:hypothetical protein